jgi:hypothetical protein
MGDAYDQTSGGSPVEIKVINHVNNFDLLLIEYRLYTQKPFVYQKLSLDHFILNILILRLLVQMMMNILQLRFLLH